MTCPHCKAENDPGSDVCFTCGRAFQALTQGSVVSNRYEVQSMLGRGGMGAVYKAYDRVLDETVALKVLRIDFADDEGLQRRFLQEIKLARKISHRNVCRIHEYGEDNGLRYISMAFVEGVDLKRLLRKGPLPVEEAYDAMVQVSEGLAAIHDEGVVHRDLKTPNILRDTKGVVRLLDFGIAKEWQAPTEQGLTGTGLLIGTPEYMSPEQVLGRKLDARSDLYSLGIVVYEVFTAQLPFRGESTVALLQKHVNQAPPLQGPEAARLPRPLVPVLRRALAKEPPLRYANALEMADALREAWAETRATTPARRGVAEDDVPTAPGKGMAGYSDTARPAPTQAGTADAATPTGAPTRTVTDPGRRNTRGPRPQTSPSMRIPRMPVEIPEDESRGIPWMWITGIVAVVAVVAMMWRRPEPAAAPVAQATAAPTEAGAPFPQTFVPPIQAPEQAQYATPEPQAAAEATEAPTAPPVPPPPSTDEPRDETSSLREECSRGAMQSCFGLAEMYRQGQGVRQDMDRALSLYDRACGRDLANACASLGYIYLHGQGVSRDPQRAISFFKRGCSGGDTTSCRMVDDISEREAQRERGGPMGGPGGGPGGPPPGGGGRR